MILHAHLYNMLHNTRTLQYSAVKGRTKCTSFILFPGCDVPDHSFSHVSRPRARAQGCGVFDVWLRFDSSSRAWYSSYLCNTTLCTSSEVVVADIHFHPCTTDGAEMDVPNFYTPHFHDACMRRTDGKMIFWPLKYQTLFVLLLHRIQSSRMINIETGASILLIHLWRVVDIVWQGARPLWCEAWSMWAWLAAGPCSIWITCHILIPARQWLRLEIHSDGRWSQIRSDIRSDLDWPVDECLSYPLIPFIISSSMGWAFMGLDGKLTAAALFTDGSWISMSEINTGTCAESSPYM